MALGTGIKLLGNLQGNASYTVDLDGASVAPKDASDEILASFQNLTDETHTISILTAIPALNQGKVYFDKALISFNIPSSASPDRQVLEDRKISFQGQWEFQNDSSNTPLHISLTKGDVAQTTFSDWEGASLLINGTTSPKAGVYSVVLDNVTSTLNGHASFTNPNTTLFYATGLDPTVLHDVQVINEDGSDLTLQYDGFEAFATGPLSSRPTGNPTSGSSASHSKGTIAALVLAGILGFLIITGTFFFLFVIRPQRRRDRQARLARRARRKEQEAGALGALNIAPTTFPDDMEMGPEGGRLGHHQKRSSGKSGFARWKREVEGGFGSLGRLGISFRHSGSTGRRSGSSGGRSRETEPLSAKSSMFTLSSSKRGQGKGKKKAKPNYVSDSSWSASFALELPVRPDSADSYKDKDKDIGPSHFSTDTHLSLTSGLHTLSYMNTPSPHPAPPPAPPSYSISGSTENSNSNSMSAPRFAPHSSSDSPLRSQAHSRQGSAGQLLSCDDPLTEEDITHNPKPFAESAPPPSDPTRLSTLAPRDRGSAQYSSDDAASLLGPASTRLAIRGLSPRTSHFPEIPDSRNGSSDRPVVPDNSASAQSQREGPSPPLSDVSFLHVVTPANQPIEIPPTEVPEVPRGEFLDIPPPSPFMVNFPSNSSQKTRESSPLEATHQHASEEGSPEESSAARNLRSVFRLTPPSNPPSGRWRSSFLDLGASSDTSPQAQSIAPSQFSTQNAPAERSRWSSSVSQTTGLSHSGSSNASIAVTSPASGPISSFPYPTSLPSSPYHPEGHISSRSGPSAPSQIDVQQLNRYPARILRLSAFGSPTDSVPISVSERRLRHSGSTGNSGNGANSSQLPPHPPLPDVHPDATTPPP
ncbi:hypothetical protein DXG01_006877 [Tephrocybe rancida]|nr:hypothetical protein DXG01_006877 [Tephrocybe rancida]